MSLSPLVRLFLAATVVIPDLAVAGREGHGGNIVKCEGGSAPVLLDYFHASLPTIGRGSEPLLELPNSEQGAVEAVLARLDPQFQDFRRKVEDALLTVGPISEWISADLKDMDDANEPYRLPPGCKRITAAIRQNGTVMYGDPEVIGLLSPAQRGLLRLHEAVYLLASSNGQTTSESVRNFMREILRKAPVQDSVREAIQKVLGKYSGRFQFGGKLGARLEVLNGIAFTPDCAGKQPCATGTKALFEISSRGASIRFVSSPESGASHTASAWLQGEKPLRHCTYVEKEGVFCELDLPKDSALSQKCGIMEVAIPHPENTPDEIYLQPASHCDLNAHPKLKVRLLEMVGGSTLWGVTER